MDGRKCLDNAVVMRLMSSNIGKLQGKPWRQKETCLEHQK